MKVLHVIRTLSAASGGPQMVVTRLARAHAELGADVTIAGYETSPGENELPVSHAGPRGSLVVTRVPSGGRMERFWPRNARAHLSEIVPGQDVVHLHGVWDSIILEAARQARRAGVPYVIAPHGMLDPWALAMKRTKKRVAMALGVRSRIAGAAMLHALSRHERESLEAAAYGPKVETFPNGVWLDEIEPLPEKGAMRRRFPALGTDPYVLFLSRLHPGKGLDILADAFAMVVKEMPELRLVVVGPDWGAEQPLRAQAAALGIADRVLITGPLWGRDRFDAMVDAACFCLPSEHEAFSVAIAEGCAAGLPVVISEECNFPEIAEAGGGLVVKRDRPAVAEALRRVLADPATAAAMGRRGRSLIEREYTWPRIAERMLAAYRGLRG